MAKIDLTPAFLIHRRAFKDTSLLLDFFTQEHGKIRLVGRGSRKSKAPIQMFQHIKISFSGKSDLKSLNDMEVDDQPRSLQGEALILGMYANELIARLLQDQDPYFELFEIYKQFINQLPKLGKQASYWALRLFENSLLSELGYGLDFEHDVNGDEIDTRIECKYEYQSQVGFTKRSIGKISGNTIQLMLAEDVLNTPNVEQLKVCRDLNRARLHPLLGNKPLQSRLLFWSKN
ncbi:DNA recombination and repair protein RecO [uncultured Candidatus Thioglobus sp.]|nr:DNA recombination and repair protein RecO [uncultured Candidatus Thioglobus sp.]